MYWPEKETKLNRIREKNKPAHSVVAFVVVVTVSASASRLHPIFANGDLDPLQCEAFAELGALDHTRELLGGEYLEGLGEDGGENGSGSVVDDGGAVGCFGGLSADIDEAHFQTGVC